MYAQSMMLRRSATVFTLAASQGAAIVEGVEANSSRINIVSNMLLETGQV
jgi:hypothetical protein